MKIILHDDHGGEHDITEHVRSLYGYTVNSLDWGSGFLSGDEELEVLEIGYLTGFEDQAIDARLESQRKSLEDAERMAEDPTVNIDAEWLKRHVVTAKEYISGLERIRESRARLLALTDDVTGFDE